MRFSCSLLFGALLSTGCAAQGTQPARPPITGIAFVRFATTQPEAADQFYGKTLGYTRQDIGGTWVYPVNHSQWIEVQPNTSEPAPASRLEAIGLTTRDLPAMQQYMRAHGVTEAEPMHDGELAVRDPAGLLVVFVQAAAGPAATHAGSLAKVIAAAPPSTSATSHRIIHAGFIVRDEAGEDAFWRGLLGFRPYWYGSMHPPHKDFVSLQVPDGADWIEYMLIAPGTPSQRDFGMSNHVSLGATHMTDVIGQLDRNGCAGKECSGIQLGVDGKVQLNVFDPDQTRVEYMEFTPARTPCCSPFTGPHPGAA